MERMKWDGTLSIGVEVIDKQHQTWIERLNDVAEALDSAQGASHIAKTLGFLVDYTRYHFGSEEKYMEETGYPELAAHRQKHHELNGTLDNLMNDFDEEGATPALAHAVDTFLQTWLVTHIKDVDQLFGDFLKEKGLTLE